MEEGEIVLVIFPQDRKHKPRPALILREFPPYGDILICGITSQTIQFIPNFDVLLERNDPAFRETGLKAASVFRLNMLTMITKGEVRGRIGKLHQVYFQQLKDNLALYIRGGKKI